MVSLIDMMEPHKYEDGQFIVREGQSHDLSLHIVTHGKIIITKQSPRGKDIRLAELTSPTLFGEVELFCQTSVISSARASGLTHTFSLSRPIFDKLFKERHPAILAFTFNVAKVASHRLAIADGMLARVLGDEDLVEMRKKVFVAMDDANEWDSEVTGAFVVPKFL